MPAKTMLVRIIAAVNLALMLPFFVLTYGIDLLTRGDCADAISVTNVAGIGALFRSQGITNDGESLYFSSKTALIKTELDGKAYINSNFSAIPDELSEKYGIAHIGGISFYNGKIYAGMEDSKVWDYPIVGVFDAQTLELTDYYILDSELVTRGLPWVAVNPDNGLLYCTDHSKQPTRLLSFDIADGMRLAGSTELSESGASVQGAEFYNGVLYAATNDSTKAIYTITLSGECSKLLDRSLASGGEGEGMTIVIENGKPVIYATDMGLLFINSFIRRYSIAQA